MKKTLLGLGSLVAVASPIAAVISCGDDANANGNGTSGTNGNHSGTTGDGILDNSGSTAFDFGIIKNQFQDMTSRKDAAALMEATKTTFTNLTAADLGIIEPSIADNDVTVRYSLPDHYTGNQPVVVTVLLSKPGYTTDGTKTFNLSPGMNDEQQAVHYLEGNILDTPLFHHELKTLTASKHRGLTQAELKVQVPGGMPTGLAITYDLANAYTGLEDVDVVAHVGTGSNIVDATFKLSPKTLDTTAAFTAWAAVSPITTKDATAIKAALTAATDDGAGYKYLTMDEIGFDAATQTKIKALLPEINSGDVIPKFKMVSIWTGPQPLVVNMILESTKFKISENGKTHGTDKAKTIVPATVTP